jgi:hypothetical protein
MPKSMSRRAAAAFLRLSPDDKADVRDTPNSAGYYTAKNTLQNTEKLASQPGAYTTEPGGDIKIAPRKKRQR